MGDIKPAELEIQFRMDLAWDINKWPVEKTEQYIYNWAKDIFGEKWAAEITAIKNEYYTLAQSGKPEHIDVVNFTYQQAKQRLFRYINIGAHATSIYNQIDPQTKGCFL